MLARLSLLPQFYPRFLLLRHAFLLGALVLSHKIKCLLFLIISEEVEQMMDVSTAFLLDEVYCFLLAYLYDLQLFFGPQVSDYHEFFGSELDCYDKLPSANQSHFDDLEISIVVRDVFELFKLNHAVFLLLWVLDVFDDYWVTCDAFDHLTCFPPLFLILIKVVIRLPLLQSPQHFGVFHLNTLGLFFPEVGVETAIHLRLRVASSLAHYRSNLLQKQPILSFYLSELVFSLHFFLFGVESQKVIPRAQKFSAWSCLFEVLPVILKQLILLDPVKHFISKRVTFVHCSQINKYCVMIGY